MLTITQIKKILGNENISDDFAREVRDMSRALAEIMFESWNKQHKHIKNKKPVKSPEMLAKTK